MEPSVRMSPQPTESWQTIFFAAAAVVVLLQTFRGWRLGIVRQIAQIVALGGAYVCAWILGPQIAPFLKPLGLPNPVLVALGGAAVGLFVYVAVSAVSAVLFKKTSDQSVGLVKLGYGLTGALVGMLFGIFIVWVGMIGIRVLGTVAETNVSAAKRLPSSGGTLEVRGSEMEGLEPNPMVRSLVELKNSLEEGPTGTVVEHLDPVPGGVYRTIEKLGLMIGNSNSLLRFMDYPGVKPLAEHPKIRALQEDPEIAKQVSNRDIFALIRNPNIVAAANDPEIMKLMGQLEFEKALDYAVGKPEKPVSAPPAY